MRKTLLKSLLVATAMVTGATNAWAAEGDVTTNVDIDFSNAISGTNPYTIVGEVGQMTWTQQWTFAPQVVDGILRFGNFNGGAVELQGDLAGSKDIVTISFDLAFGKLSGKHVGFDFVDEDGTNILTQWFDAYNGDFDDANPLNLNWDGMFRGNNTVMQERCVNFTITLNYATSTITTNTQCYLSGTGKERTDKEYTASLPSNKPIAKFVLQGNTNNADRYSTFDNLKITTTEGNYDAATANYTVKYVCDDVEIKDAELRNGDVDASISLVATDKANFTADENTRYIYVSDDAEGKTIAEDGSTIVTVTFRKAAIYNYTINSTYEGNTLAFATAGKVFEDQNSVTVRYPRFQTYNKTTLVELGPVNNNLTKTFTIDADGYENALEYVSTGISNLYLLSEAENLETGLSTNGTPYTDRVSNGLIIFGSEGTLVNLPAGKYIFTLGAIGGDNNTHKVAYTVSAGENQIISTTVTGNFLTLATSSEFTLTAPTDITFTCSDPASGRGIDLIYIQQTGVTITPANALSTFASVYDLDFTNVEGLTAYIADNTIDEVENKIVLTEVDKIAAGEGMVLAGTAATTYNVPVTTGVANPTTNYLVGVTVDTSMEGIEGYVLATDGMFHPVNGGTLKAGKAFLSVPATAGSISILFGDESTGIETVKSENVLGGDIFNLRGQRVAAPHKGLYIMQGKKMVIK